MESKTPEAGSVPAGPSSAEIFHLILTMQRQQMTWMENQQKWQEEWMQLKQEAQREMMERMREQQERGRVEARRAAKFPKPTLQKLSKKDDVESYLDMFERVGVAQGNLDYTACQAPLRQCLGMLLIAGPCHCQRL